MSKYVDGFVMPVPKKNLSKYRKMAQVGKRVWMDHGALAYFECAGDDMKGMPGCLPFPKLAKARPDEIVFFSFIVFKSRKHRDEVNKKVMKDARMNMDAESMKKMPFDPRKMAYGGFEVLVEG